MIDARGYSCPMPVVMVQKEIKGSSPGTLCVTVDDLCAVENVTRYAKSCGYSVECTQQGSDYLLELKK